MIFWFSTHNSQFTRYLRFLRMQMMWLWLPMEPLFSRLQLTLVACWAHDSAIRHSLDTNLFNVDKTKNSKRISRFWYGTMKASSWGDVTNYFYLNCERIRCVFAIVNSSSSSSQFHCFRMHVNSKIEYIFLFTKRKMVTFQPILLMNVELSFRKLQKWNVCLTNFPFSIGNSLVSLTTGIDS